MHSILFFYELPNKVLSAFTLEFLKYLKCNFSTSNTKKLAPFKMLYLKKIGNYL